MKRLLILGASGLVGKALVEECKDAFDISGTYFSSPLTIPNEKQFQLDVQDINRLKEIIQTIEPDSIISCLRGDFAQQLVFHEQLALEVKNSNCVLYYFSTANVFDGDLSKHFSETDIPVAESDYGIFKIACEKVLQDILGERAVIIRIPAIWGEDSLRFHSIKEQLRKNEAIDVHKNLECNNLLDTQLARQLHYMMVHKLKGIFHLGATDMILHEQFVKQLVNLLTDKEVQFKYESLPKEKKYYFGLLSIRKDIPLSLRSTNEEIIAELVRRTHHAGATKEY